jgi:hypothetical protein
VNHEQFGASMLGNLRCRPQRSAGTGRPIVGHNMVKMPWHQTALRRDQHERAARRLSIENRVRLSKRIGQFMNYY